MKYPQEFVDKCKQVYPGWVELHRKLDSGDTFAGRYLDDARQGLQPLEEVISGMTPEEVALAVKQYHDRKECYIEWGKLYDTQFPRRTT
jgi:predicted component of type VI protein secretion system